jgi:hypothetical protein
MSEESLESQLEEMFSGIGAFDPELDEKPRLQEASVSAGARSLRPVRRPEMGDINLDGRNTLVVFRLAEYTCALPIEPIVQIVEMVAVTTIPQAMHSLEGGPGCEFAPPPRSAAALPAYRCPHRSAPDRSKDGWAHSGPGADGA